MNNLYTDLAKVYEAMYATFIDYTLEHRLYSSFLKKHNKQSILEIGFGTGNLAQHFIEDGYTYDGLDLSQEMLTIAKERNPKANFMQGDMRNFDLGKQVQSVLMAGRTISYLVKNEDVTATLRSIYSNLEKGGILCFDFIDATRFIPEISGGKSINHKAQYNGLLYHRTSKWSTNILHGWSFDWESTYYKEEGNDLVEIGTDNSTIRTFTKDEIELFLSLSGFEVREIRDKESYAFPTFVVVAEKI